MAAGAGAPVHIRRAFPDLYQYPDVQIDPSRSGALYASTDGGVYRSNDSGLTWTSTAPRDVRTPYGLSRRWRSMPAAFVGAGCGVERSTDGGRSWRPTLSCDVRHWDSTFTRFVTRLRTDPQRPQVVYAEVTEESERHPPTVFPLRLSQQGWRADLETPRRGFHPDRLRSAEGPDPLSGEEETAVSAQRQRRPHLESHRHSRTRRRWGFDLLVDRAELRTLYSAGRVDVYRSLDGGATWTPFSNGLRGVRGNLIRDPRRPVLLHRRRRSCSRSTCRERSDGTTPRMPDNSRRCPPARTTGRRKWRTCPAPTPRMQGQGPACPLQERKIRVKACACPGATPQVAGESRCWQRASSRCPGDSSTLEGAAAIF